MRSRRTSQFLMYRPHFTVDSGDHRGNWSAITLRGTSIDRRQAPAATLVPVGLAESGNLIDIWTVQYASLAHVGWMSYPSSLPPTFKTKDGVISAFASCLYLSTLIIMLLYRSYPLFRQKHSSSLDNFRPYCNLPAYSSRRGNDIPIRSAQCTMQPALVCRSAGAKGRLQTELQ